MQDISPEDLFPPVSFTINDRADEDMPYTAPCKEDSKVGILLIMRDEAQHQGYQQKQQILTARAMGSWNGLLDLDGQTEYQARPAILNVRRSRIAAELQQSNDFSSICRSLMQGEHKHGKKEIAMDDGGDSPRHKKSNGSQPAKPASDLE